MKTVLSLDQPILDAQVAINAVLKKHYKLGGHPTWEYQHISFSFDRLKNNRIGISGRCSFNLVYPQSEDSKNLSCLVEFKRKEESKIWVPLQVTVYPNFGWNKKLKGGETTGVFSYLAEKNGGYTLLSEVSEAKRL